MGTRKIVPIFSFVNAALILFFPLIFARSADSKSTSIMHGMYFYMADAGIFYDCKSGITFPVEMEADNRTLESAYLKARKNPGESILVKLEGRIEKRMPMEGPGPVDKLIPVKFLDIFPGEDCSK